MLQKIFLQLNLTPARNSRKSTEEERYELSGCIVFIAGELSALFPLFPRKCIEFQIAKSKIKVIGLEGLIEESTPGQ